LAKERRLRKLIAHRRGRCRAGRRLRSFEGLAGVLTLVAFYRDGEPVLLLSGTVDGTPRLWQTHSGE